MKFAKYANSRRCKGCGEWSDLGRYCSACAESAADPNMTASEALGHMLELFPGREFFVGVTESGLAQVGFCELGKVHKWEGETWASAVAAARREAGR